MDPSDFFTAARVLIVAGKGGVGKTTVSAAVGVAAATVGLDTLLVEIEGKHGLASIFGLDDDSGRGLGHDEVELIASTEAGGRLRAQTIQAREALVDYFDDHGLNRFGKTLTKFHVLDTLATSTPGLKDLIVLGKIKQLESTASADLIVVDAPASGHAISFLRAARGLQDTVDTGPIRRQADEVVAMLTDPARAEVLLVTLPEETPVNELVETAYALEEEVGVRLGPAVVNALTPPRSVSRNTSTSKAVAPELAKAAAAAADYWCARASAQAAQHDRLAAELPLDQIVLTRQPTVRMDRGCIDTLAAELLAQISDLRFAEDR